MVDHIGFGFRHTKFNFQQRFYFLHLYNGVNDSVFDIQFIKGISEMECKELDTMSGT